MAPSPHIFPGMKAPVVDPVVAVVVSVVPVPPAPLDE
jgi:hypothetical protein